MCARKSVTAPNVDRALDQHYRADKLDNSGTNDTHDFETLAHAFCSGKALEVAYELPSALAGGKVAINVFGFSRIRNSAKAALCCYFTPG